MMKRIKILLIILGLKAYMNVYITLVFFPQAQESLTVIIDLVCAHPAIRDIPLSQRIRGMVRKAKGINTLGYCFSDIFFFSATSVTATVGMVMVVTPHTLTPRII